MTMLKSSSIGKYDKSKRIIIKRHKFLLIIGTEKSKRKNDADEREAATTSSLERGGGRHDVVANKYSRRQIV